MPLVNKKNLFEWILIEKDGHFVKLNDFFTSLSNGWHFTTFEVKKLLKTLVTAHQSLTFALFCQLIPENFKNIGTKIDLQCLAYKLAICQVYKIRCCSGMAQYKIFINGSFETAFSQFSSNNSKISKISRLLNF